jgi:lactate permease
MLVLAALPPILSSLLFLVVLKARASVAMPLCFGLTAMATTIIWKVPLRRVLAATLEGWIITATILWIVFGAAAAVVGLSGKEGGSIRFALFPMLYYCVFAGLLGLVMAGISAFWRRRRKGPLDRGFSFTENMERMSR